MFLRFDPALSGQLNAQKSVNLRNLGHQLCSRSWLQVESLLRIRQFSCCTASMTTHWKHVAWWRKSPQCQGRMRCSSTCCADPSTRQTYSRPRVISLASNPRSSPSRLETKAWGKSLRHVSCTQILIPACDDPDTIIVATQVHNCILRVCLRNLFSAKSHTDLSQLPRSLLDLTPTVALKTLNP